MAIKTTGNSKLDWPPEQTIEYKFGEELELELPLIENNRGQKEQMEQR